MFATVAILYLAEFASVLPLIKFYFRELMSLHKDPISIPNFNKIGLAVLVSKGNIGTDSLDLLLDCRDV